MNRNVTQAEALELIAAYGADVARWPVALRADVLALAAHDPVVAAALAEARDMDRLLAQWAGDVPMRTFDPETLIPAPRQTLAPTGAGWKAPRWLGGGALAASVAAALLLGVPAMQLVAPGSGDAEIAQSSSEPLSLGSASGQGESMDDFALVFTPTADEEDLI